MDQRYLQWIASSILVLMTSSLASAQPSSQTQLDTLVQQLDHLEAVNNEVRLELDAARADLSDGWHDEQRSAQVASIVQEIINDADTRTNLRGGGLMMGWSNGFFLSSADGRHTLKVSGMMQMRYMGSWVGHDNPTLTDQWQSGFDIPRIKFTFSGTAAKPNIEYFIQTGWGRLDPDAMSNDDDVSGQRLWQAWGKMKIADDLALKIGQFNLPFTRETLVDASRQLVIEKSLVDHRMGLQMSTGVELVWGNQDRRFFFAYTNGSGAMLWSNAMFAQRTIMPPWSALNRDTSYSFTLRHEWKLSGGWEQFNQFTSPPGSGEGVLIGIACHRQNLESDDTVLIGGSPSGTMWGVTADASLLFDGASFFVSGVYHRIKDFRLNGPLLDIDWYGVVAQGSTYVTNSTEFYSRFEAGGSSDNLGGDPLQLLTFGVNHYLDGQDMKLSADVGFSFGEIPGTLANSLTGWRRNGKKSDQVVIRTQLQMMF
jgi:hypothetical protein